MCIQGLEHEDLGAIYYEWPRYWPAMLDQSRAARDRLGGQHERFASMSAGPDGTRTLRYDAVEPAIEAHVQMVIGAVLAMRYFILELERVAGFTVTGDDDIERFRAACRSVGLADPADQRTWSLVGELVSMRHRIEHPSQETIYSVKDWDRVPLAWCLTRRALDCFDAFDASFSESADAWEQRRVALSKPGTFEIAERGLRGRRPPKGATGPAPGRS